MTKEQYKKLKVGDVVSLRLGKNKGEKATVTFIWDDGDRSNDPYGFVEVKFINPNLHNATFRKVKGGTALSYKALKYEETQH